MPDFTWIHEHPLIRTRGAVQADFERLSYKFRVPEPSTNKDTRPARPRTVGETTDGRARVEIIGPPEAAFKATIMVVTPPRSELLDFLAVMTPEWTEGPSWVSTQVHGLAADETAETHYQDFLVTLRVARGGGQVVLGVTWLPAAGGS